jgi:hypothetical protein
MQFPGNKPLIINFKRKSEKEGIHYGIAAKCGLGFPIQTDKEIEAYIENMRQYPQFYVGMQAEGVLFTIGTNNVDKNFPPPHFAEEMIVKCRLSNNDFWPPELKNE